LLAFSGITACGDSGEKKKSVKQASEKDIPVIESILLDAVHWMDANNLHQWEECNVHWESLSKNYAVNDFHIAYADGNPAACMALIDYDPFFWPDVQKGESLYIHKLAVTRKYAGQGFSTMLINFAKQTARQSGINAIRLDCHKNRAKVRAVYERHGFICVGEKNLFGKYETAFYVWKNIPPTR
jgi:GNAT superfamily N-acetyltransferase